VLSQAMKRCHWIMEEWLVNNIDHLTDTRDQIGACYIGAGLVFCIYIYSARERRAVLDP